MSQNPGFTQEYLKFCPANHLLLFFKLQSTFLNKCVELVDRFCCNLIGKLSFLDQIIMFFQASFDLIMKLFAFENSDTIFSCSNFRQFNSCACFLFSDNNFSRLRVSQQNSTRRSLVQRLWTSPNSLGGVSSMVLPLPKIMLLPLSSSDCSVFTLKI